MPRNLISQDQVKQSETYSDKEIEKTKDIKKKEIPKPKEENR